MSALALVAIHRTPVRSNTPSTTWRLRSALAAICATLCLSTDSRAQQCLGRPQNRGPLLAGAALENAGRTTLVASRVGVSGGRASVTGAVGVRSGYGLGSTARVLQAELAASLSSRTDRAQWCVLLQADRQQGPDVAAVGATIRAREHGYEAGLAFGEALGGTREDPSSLVLSGRFGFRRGVVSTESSLGASNERTDGVFVGLGLSVLVRPWLSTGVHGRAALLVPGTASRSLLLDVSAAFF